MSERTVFPIICDDINTELSDIPDISNVTGIEVKNENIPNLEGYAEFIENLNSKILREKG